MSEIGISASPNTAHEIAPIEGAYHYPVASPEEANAINDNFTINVYGCVHGMPPLGEGDQQSVDNAYDAAAAVIHGLDPSAGDKLFIEGVNHDDFEPLFYQLFDIRRYGEHGRGLLEKGRQERTIDPLGYAMSLALFKDLPVVTADMHSNITEQFQQVTGVPIGSSHEEVAGLPLFPVYNTLRNEQAAATVKDDALRSLPGLHGQKPTYALMMGPAHTDATIAHNDGLPSVVSDVFEHMGLRVNTILLPNAYEGDTSQAAHGLGSIALAGAAQS